MSLIEKLDFLTTGLLFASRITVSDFVVPICTMWVSVSQNLEIENENQAVIWSFSLIILNFWDDFEHQIPFQWRKETTLIVFHQNFHGSIITIAQIVILFLSLLMTVSLFDQALAQTTVHFFRSAKHPTYCHGDKLSIGNAIDCLSQQLSSQPCRILPRFALKAQPRPR